MSVVLVCFCCSVGVTATTFVSPLDKPVGDLQLTQGFNTLREASGAFGGWCSDKDFQPINYSKENECATAGYYFWRWKHTGVDIHTNNDGTENVLAITPGTVEYSANHDGYKPMVVVVRHNDGFCSLYGHLHSRDVAKGDPIAAGQKIGIASNHLHLSVYKCDMPKGGAVLPWGYLYKDDGTDRSLHGNTFPANSISFFCDPLHYLQSGGECINGHGDKLTASVIPFFSNLDWVRTTDTLNMREHPDTSSRIIRELPASSDLFIWTCPDGRMGPVEADGYRFWCVLSASSPTEPVGWASGHRLSLYLRLITPTGLIEPTFNSLFKIDGSTPMTLLSQALLPLCPDCGGTELALPSLPAPTTTTNNTIDTHVPPPNQSLIETTLPFDERERFHSAGVGETILF